jgi:hypothetical protein
MVFEVPIHDLIGEIAYKQPPIAFHNTTHIGR